MEKHACYERLFNNFDIDGDGKISLLDLQNCVITVYGEDLTVAETAMMMELFGSNGDGSLGLEDFVRFVEERGEEEKIVELKEAFKMYEMEGFGIITPESLRSMLSKLGESKSVDDCKAMISKFDLNSDGVLNFDEFRVMMML